MKSNWPDTASSPLMIFISTSPWEAGSVLPSVPPLPPPSAVAGSVVSGSAAAAVAPPARRRAGGGGGRGAGGIRGGLSRGMGRGGRRCKRRRGPGSRGALAPRPVGAGERGGGAALLAARRLTCCGLDRQEPQQERQDGATHSGKPKGACNGGESTALGPGSGEQTAEQLQVGRGPWCGPGRSAAGFPGATQCPVRCRVNDGPVRGQLSLYSPGRGVRSCRRPQHGHSARAWRKPFAGAVVVVGRHLNAAPAQGRCLGAKGSALQGRSGQGRPGGLRLLRPEGAGSELRGGGQLTPAVAGERQPRGCSQALPSVSTAAAGPGGSRCPLLRHTTLLPGRAAAATPPLCCRALAARLCTRATMAHPPLAACSLAALHARMQRGSRRRAEPRQRERGCGGRRTGNLCGRDSRGGGGERCSPRPCCPSEYTMTQARHALAP